MVQFPDYSMKIVSLVIALVSLVSTIGWLKLENKDQKPYVIAPILYALHLSGFYIYLVIKAMGYIEPIDIVVWNKAVNIWSSSLRLHGILTFTGLVVMMVARLQSRNK